MNHTIRDTHGHRGNIGGMESVAWIVAGAILMAIGLAIWFTAFVLVPLGVVFIIVGIVSAVRRSFAKKASSDQPPA